MSYDKLQIFRPCISKRITQRWGENRACFTKDGRVIGVRDFCPAGTQSVYKRFGMMGHNGIDIGGMSGSDIYHAATYEGYMKTEHDSSGGIGVDVISYEKLFFEGEPPHYLQGRVEPTSQNGKQGFICHIKMRYWHLKSAVGYDGRHVEPGQTIGLMGNTGVSSATHLHFAPKWCDKDGKSLAIDNGYRGAFDPGKYYNHNYTAREHIEMLKQEVPPLTEKERKDMAAQLSALEMLLVTLQKLIHKL